MKVVITGATGLLGKALIAIAKRRYTDCYTKERKIDLLLMHGDGGSVSTEDKWAKLDLVTGEGLSEIKKFNPNIIIHCAAMGSVDYAQSNYNGAMKVNLRGTMDLLALAEEINSKFVFLSTNAVFKGDDPPYDEIVLFVQLIIMVFSKLQLN